MAMFVIAGRADCPRFARAEMLADQLAASLPHFRVHKVMQPSDEWPSWLSEQCSKNGWQHHSGSPLVWRELVDRGGKGLYLGGLSEFERYALHYYNIAPSTTRDLEEAIAKENLDTLISLKLEKENAPKVEPLRVCVTNASSAIAYHLVQQIAEGAVFGEHEYVAIHLYDCNEENAEEVESLAMELTDLASPVLHEVRVSKSVREAMDSVKMAFVLDFPYQPEVKREEEMESGDVRESCDVVAEQKAAKDNKEEEEGEKEKVEGEGEAETEGRSSDQVEREGSAPLAVIKEEEVAMEKAELEEEDKQEKSAESAASATPPEKSAESAASAIPPEQSAESAVSATPPELVEAAHLYHKYGATVDFCSHKDVRVIVCGRYANTGAAIMAKAVSSIEKSNFIASPCLAEQQAKSILASRLSLNAADISQVALWGSTTGKVFPDLTHVRVKHFPGAVVGPDPYDLPLTRCVFDTKWLETQFEKLFEARHTRMEGYRRNAVGGAAALVEAIGLVSLTKEWREGSSVTWRCVGVASNEAEEGAFGVPVGVVFSQPVCIVDGHWKPAKDLALTDKVKDAISSQVRSLEAELTTAMEVISEGDNENMV